MRNVNVNKNTFIETSLKCLNFSLLLADGDSLASVYHCGDSVIVYVWSVGS